MKGTTRIQTCAIFAGVFLLAAGCSSKTKPTDQNFLAGLNAYYANHNECLFSSALRFPYEVSPSLTAKQDKQRMDALMNSGLMKVTEDRTIHVNVYALTAAGERAGGRFCYGHRQITGIDSFTPAHEERQWLARVACDLSLQDDGCARLGKDRRDDESISRDGQSPLR